MGITVGISLLSCIQADELYDILFLVSVSGRHILLPPILTSGSLCSNLVVFPDPKNMRLALGIALLPSLGAEMCAFQFFEFSTSGSSHFCCTVLMLVLLECPTPKTGLAVESALLSSLGAEILAFLGYGDHHLGFSNSVSSTVVVRC